MTFVHLLDRFSLRRCMWSAPWPPVDNAGSIRRASFFDMLANTRVQGTYRVGKLTCRWRSYKWSICRECSVRRYHTSRCQRCIGQLVVWLRVFRCIWGNTRPAIWFAWQSGTAALGTLSSRKSIDDLNTSISSMDPRSALPRAHLVRFVHLSCIL